MTKFLKLMTALIVAAFAVGSLTACSTAEPMDMTNIAAVVDVRTAEEFATGHLDGALNFDVQSAAFVEQVSSLDPAADYVVYCRSGNRSTAAIESMQALGFTGTLTNGGAVANASMLTGIEIVQ
jgi:phage shock protein E